MEDVAYKASDKFTRLPFWGLRGFGVKWRRNIKGLVASPTLFVYFLIFFCTIHSFIHPFAEGPLLYRNICTHRRRRKLHFFKIKRSCAGELFQILTNVNTVQYLKAEVGERSDWSIFRYRFDLPIVLVDVNFQFLAFVFKKIANVRHRPGPE